MKNELEIKVNAKICVDKNTAEACLKFVELYVNQNNVDVIAEKTEFGEVKFHYEPA